MFWKVLVPLSVLAWVLAVVATVRLVSTRHESDRRRREGFDVVSAPLRKGEADSICSIGKTDSPYTIHVFFDYQCPYCRDASPELDGLLKKHAGVVRAIFHNFPLETIHEDAWRASVASVVAARHHVFDKVRAKLLTSEDLPATVEANVKSALPNVKITDSEITDAARLVMADVALAHKMDINGTPTLYLVDPQGVVRRFDSLDKISDYFDRVLTPTTVASNASTRCLGGCGVPQ